MGQRLFRPGYEYQQPDGKDGRYIKDRLEAIKKSFEVVDPLIPNGLFPQEIVEHILIDLDTRSLARIACTCKLWLQACTRVFKYTYQHRYVLPPNVDLSNFNWREEVLKQHLIEQQMAKGHCWPQVLIHDYSSQRSRTSFQHKWSHHGNVSAITKEKIHHSYVYLGRIYNQFQCVNSDPIVPNTTLIDLSGSGAEEETVYGTQFVGGVKVVPKATHFADWDWEEVSCYNGDNVESTIITRKNKFIHNYAAGLWDKYRGPKRLMQGYANLDGTPQLLIYDMNTTYGRSGSDDFVIEVWDVTNGDLIHETKLLQVGDEVVGFYKNFAIMTLINETLFVNLTSGLVEQSFPHASTKHSYHLFDNKIAFFTDAEMCLYEWDSCTLIKQINIDMFKSKEPFIFTGVSFDKWKLVVSTKVKEVRTAYSRQHGGFIAVFDMRNQFALLCTKYIAHWNKSFVQIACLPNGSIVVNDSSLLVFDFIHPYLEKPMSVAVFKAGASSVQVVKINPLDLTAFATKALSVEFGTLKAISYYEVDPSEAPRPRTTNNYLNRSAFTHLKPKSRRITFITVRAGEDLRHAKKATDVAQQTFKGSFLEYWHKHVDTIAPFVLTNSNVDEKPSPANHESIMVFEKFNENTQQWELTDPFVPQGTNIEIVEDA